MPKKHLTDKFIRNETGPGKRTDYYDQHKLKNGEIEKLGVKGLFIRITKAGNKYFYYRYWLHGKAHNYKVGDYGNISLTDARNKARELSQQVSNGIDPAAKRRREKHKPEKMLFRELADIFIKEHVSQKKPRTAKEYTRHIKTEMLDNFKWGDIPVSEFTSQHVRKVLRDKAVNQGCYTMANRLRSTISKLFDYGLKNVGIDLNSNPVDKTPVYEQGENTRDRVYNEHEIKQLWEHWDSLPEPIRSYYKIVLITGQRKTETMCMKWDDIELNKPCSRIKINANGRAVKETFQANIWNIAEYKTDSEREIAKVHEIPLPAMAIHIIRELKPLTGDSQWVFESPTVPGQRLKSVKTRSEEIQNSFLPGFRLHDLRRTVETRLAEMGVEEIVGEKILNHAAKGVTQKHYNWYQYTDQKQKALQLWANRLDTIINGGGQQAKISKMIS